MNILTLDDVYDLFIYDRRCESDTPNYFFSLDTYKFEETKELVKRFKIGFPEKKWIFREANFEEIESGLLVHNYVPFFCSSEEYKKCMWLFLEKLNNDEITSYFQSIKDSDDFILQFVIRFDGDIGDLFEDFTRKCFFKNVIKWCKKYDIRFLSQEIYK